MLMSSLWKWCLSKRRFSPHYLVGHNTLSVPSPAALCEVIDSGELDQGGEDKSVADSNEPVHGSSVGHFRERVPCADAEGGHGQHGGHPWVQTKVATSVNWVFTVRLETGKSLASVNKGGRFNKCYLLATAVLLLSGQLLLSSLV